jgi:hypothetical protein
MPLSDGHYSQSPEEFYRGIGSLLGPPEKPDVYRCNECRTKIDEPTQSGLCGECEVDLPKTGEVNMSNKKEYAIVNKLGYFFVARNIITERDTIELFTKEEAEKDIKNFYPGYKIRKMKVGW